MRAALTERFQLERSRYRLAFACEDCTHFDAERSRCAHGYPTAVHRRAAFEPGGALDGMFCKEFEVD